MPVFSKADTHLLFIHVPKTGGTSIEKLFAQSGWSVDYVEYSMHGKKPFRLCSPQHMHAPLLKENFDLAGFDGVFMTARHPYARFRSEYCMVNPSVRLPDADQVDSWASRVFHQYLGQPYILDNHIRPQHEFYLPGAQVFYLESGFAAIRTEICRLYGIELVEAEYHELHSQSFTGIDSQEIPLGKMTQAKIRQFYAEDFNRFDFPSDAV